MNGNERMDLMTNTDKDDEVIPMPRDSYELIGMLDEMFPPRCIGRNESLEAANRYAGVRDLVEELVAWKDEELSDAVS